MLDYVAYNPVPVLEDIEYYKGRDVHAYLFKKDAPSWARDKVGACECVDFILGMGDFDDFGGQIYYFVPYDMAEYVETELISWVNNLVLEQISDVYKQGFFPKFEGCKTVNNW